MKKISIVVPCYNEQDTVETFEKEIVRIFSEPLSEYTYEVLYVDDGSSDDTLTKIKELAERSGRVKYVSFSRNFGKEAAIYAGLTYADGEYIAVMDVDLQDPPELLPEMAAILESGVQCAAARRIDRSGESPIRSLFSEMFYSLFRRLAGINVPDGARDYRMMTREFVKDCLKLKEYNRFSKGIFDWVGHSVTWITYENRQRVCGTTKWSFWKLVLYSIDAVFSFSTAPAVLASLFGTFFCVLAFFFLLIIFARAMLYGDPVAGWPSTICIILLIGGIQLLCLGILGLYMAKTYSEVKHRPIYLCEETNIEKATGDDQR